jgi:hypothetical protein
MKRKLARFAPVVAAAVLPLVVPLAGLPSASADEHLPEWPEVNSARLVPIQETGPATDRLNLIVMCDGYQAHEMDKCAADVDRNQAVQWSVEPFRSYRHHVNVYRLEIVSPESGVRCDPDEEGGPKPDKITPLRMVFQQGCVDPLARGVIYNNTVGGSGGPGGPGTALPAGTPSGNQQRTFYLDNYVAPVLGIPSGSQNLQTLAIFNTFTYGGIGGTHATTSGGSPQGPLISLHELGHSLGAMQDEYPYSSRPTPGPPHPNSEPSSFHHTRMSSEQMTENQVKWWRWLGEESESGGIIRAADPDGYESGTYNGSNVWRPSEHSMMRWIGFYFDQIGREHMVARIAGRRNAAQMSLGHTPAGDVPQDGVLWVDTTHPKFHELQVSWRVGGPDGEAVETGNSRNLDLEPLNLEPGTVVHVEVRDPVGPDGIDWVRNPSTGSTATNSGYNGPRFVQTRQWTVGESSASPTPTGDVELVTGSTPTHRPVAGDEVVYVETGHPADRVLDVAWTLNGVPVAPSTDRTLDLAALGLASGTHQLTATVTDPAEGGGTQTVTWAVDNVLPSAPRSLSEPLAALAGDLEHNVYFNEFDMLLEPQDNRTGYDEDLYVVGELRLNEDGWFNYFGFPEQPFGTPFTFSHTGKDVKALTYGNLGTGGLSKATFEQSYDDTRPNGPFVPGFGTHQVEHRAIDPAGNIGDAGEFRATVLPGELLECTQTISGTRRNDVRVTAGVTCLDGAQINGNVSVAAGGSLLATDSTINGNVTGTGAEAIQLFGTTVNGLTRITRTVTDVTFAGNQFTGDVVLTANDQEQANDQFFRFGYEYGPIVVGNTVMGDLRCSTNSAPARDFEAPNKINGTAGGDCSAL